MVSTQILKQLRAQHGWTQEQLATISGVSSRTIQRIEQTGDCSLESKMVVFRNLCHFSIIKKTGKTHDSKLRFQQSFS